MTNRQPIKPNPDRALVIAGDLTFELLEKLLLDIHRFKAASQEPITLYIQSPGGLIEVADQLFALIRTGENPCPVVSVATTYTASAAALILSQSDYAWAYPGCRLVYHGPRLNIGEMTREQAGDIQRNLGSKANDLARTLGLAIFPRTLRIMRELNAHALKMREALSNGSGGLVELARQVQANCDSKILSCWIAFLDCNLSPNAHRLLEEAVQTTLRSLSLQTYASLFDDDTLTPILQKVFARDAFNIANDELDGAGKLVGLSDGDRRQKVQGHTSEILDNILPQTGHSRDLAALLAVISDLAPFAEPETADSCWEQIFQAFLDMRQYRTRDFLQELSRRAIEHAPHFLPDEDCAWLDANFPDNLDSGENKARFEALIEVLHREVHPIFLFTSAIARDLQTADFPLNSKDALLLGLVDGICGASPTALDPDQPLPKLD